MDRNKLDNYIPEHVTSELNRLYAIYDSPGMSIHYDDKTAKVVIRFNRDSRPNKSADSNVTAKWRRMNDQQVNRDRNRGNHKGRSRRGDGQHPQRTAVKPPVIPKDTRTPAPPVASAVKPPAPPDIQEVTKEPVDPVITGDDSSVPSVDSIAAAEVLTDRPKDQVELMSVDSQTPSKENVKVLNHTATPFTPAPRVPRDVSQLAAPLTPTELAVKLLPELSPTTPPITDVVFCMLCKNEIWNDETCYLCVVCGDYECGCGGVGVHTHQGYVDSEIWLGEETLETFREMWKIKDAT